MIMEKSWILIWILVLNACNILLVKCEYHTKSLPYEPVLEQKTNLHFYLHDIVSGKNPTAVPIARVNSGLAPFGTLLVVDDPLTEGPELTSKRIGNARGMYVSASQGSDLTLVVYFDIGFTSGEFNGSSLSVFSRNPITESPRELAIVGGRGKFRYARGYITVTTNPLSNFTTGDAVLEYNVEVIHP